MNLIMIRYMKTTTITQLLRDPKGVIRKVEKASEILIKRRDADPLRLSLDSRVAEDREGAVLLARVLVRALPSMELTKAVWEPLVDLYPWLRFLPEPDRITFIQELGQTIESCASLGNNAPLAQLLREWKATAEIHADPALAAALQRRLSGTRIRVPRPKGR